MSKATSASPLMLVFALASAAALSLGLARFAYGLLLPTMRTELGWSYALAGALNTANAVGYLLGALCSAKLIARLGSPKLMMWGGLLATLSMAFGGFFSDAAVWMLLRLLAGVGSAWVFVTGGVLASQVALRVPQQSGLMLGIYYGGAGLGILLSAWLVPLAFALMSPAVWRYPAWAWGWWSVALACWLMLVVMAWPARVMRQPISTQTETPMNSPSSWHLLPCLLSYTCFGMGYIGYMTFIIALLRNQGISMGQMSLFYSLLGIACMASSRLWAGLLSRHGDGKPMALLNGLLGVAALIPVVTQQWVWMLASALMFGGVFLSVVASTTALVRHQWPQAAWTRGITLFTVVFAAGQIIGPILVGWISDGAGGLERGLAVSAGILLCGAVLALFQRPPVTPSLSR
jgi:predicted MFS family arabinose efflux permease